MHRFLAFKKKNHLFRELCNKWVTFHFESEKKMEEEKTGIFSQKKSFL